MKPQFDVRPVTAENWDDFARLFEARGGPHFCWCTAYRLSKAAELEKHEKKASMKRLISSGKPIGVLAYEGSEPKGWCSVAPRETYAKLERSRTMPRATPVATSTWTVLCFFVSRTHRGKGLAAALLEGAIAYARAAGGQIIEATHSTPRGLARYTGDTRACSRRPGSSRTASGGVVRSRSAGSTATG